MGKEPRKKGIQSFIALTLVLSLIMGAIPVYAYDDGEDFKPLLSITVGQADFVVGEDVKLPVNVSVGGDAYSLSGFHGYVLFDRPLDQDAGENVRFSGASGDYFSSYILDNDPCRYEILAMETDYGATQGDILCNIEFEGLQSPIGVAIEANGKLNFSKTPNSYSDLQMGNMDCATVTWGGVGRVMEDRSSLSAHDFTYDGTQGNISKAQFLALSGASATSFDGSVLGESSFFVELNKVSSYMPAEGEKERVTVMPLDASNFKTVYVNMTVTNGSVEEDKSAVTAGDFSYDRINGKLDMSQFAVFSNLQVTNTAGEIVESPNVSWWVTDVDQDLYTLINDTDQTGTFSVKVTDSDTLKSANINVTITDSSVKPEEDGNVAFSMTSASVNQHESAEIQLNLTTQGSVAAIKGFEGKLTLSRALKEDEQLKVESASGATIAPTDDPLVYNVTSSGIFGLNPFTQQTDNTVLKITLENADSDLTMVPSVLNNVAFYRQNALSDSDANTLDPNNISVQGGSITVTGAEPQPQHDAVLSASDFSYDLANGQLTSDAAKTLANLKLSDGSAIVAENVVVDENDLATINSAKEDAQVPLKFSYTEPESGKVLQAQANVTVTNSGAEKDRSKDKVIIHVEAGDKVAKGDTLRATVYPEFFGDAVAICGLHGYLTLSRPLEEGEQIEVVSGDADDRMFEFVPTDDPLKYEIFGYGVYGVNPISKSEVPNVAVVTIKNIASDITLGFEPDKDMGYYASDAKGIDNTLSFADGAISVTGCDVKIVEEADNSKITANGFSFDITSTKLTKDVAIDRANVVAISADGQEIAKNNIDVDVEQLEAINNGKSGTYPLTFSAPGNLSIQVDVQVTKNETIDDVVPKLSIVIDSGTYVEGSTLKAKVSLNRSSDVMTLQGIHADIVIDRDLIEGENIKFEGIGDDIVFYYGQEDNDPRRFEFFGLRQYGQDFTSGEINDVLGYIVVENIQEDIGLSLSLIGSHDVLLKNATSIFDNKIIKLENVSVSPADEIVVPEKESGEININAVDFTWREEDGNLTAEQARKVAQVSATDKEGNPIADEDISCNAEQLATINNGPQGSYKLTFTVKDGPSTTVSVVKIEKPKEPEPVKPELGNIDMVISSAHGYVGDTLEVNATLNLGEGIQALSGVSGNFILSRALTSEEKLSVQPAGSQDLFIYSGETVQGSNKYGISSAAVYGKPLDSDETNYNVARIAIENIQSPIEITFEFTGKHAYYPSGSTAVTDLQELDSAKLISGGKAGVMSVSEKPVEPKERVTVVFKDANGNVLSSISLEKGAILEDTMIPEAPAIEGKKFTGFETLDGQKISAGSEIEENITLTAKYEDLSEEKVVVSFKNYYGDIISIVSLSKGAALQKSSFPEAPAVPGKDFKGWNAPDGSEFKPGVTVENDIIVSAVYADQEAKEITISFVDDAGNLISKFDTLSGTALSSENFPQPPEVEGKYFTGWINSKGSEVSEGYVAYESETISAKYYSIIGDVKYTVLFRSSDNKTLSTMEVDEGYKLKAEDFPAVPEVDGKQFIGWKDNMGKAVSEGYRIIDDTYVIAYYEAFVPKVSVSFIGDGGQTLETRSVKKGSTLKFADFPKPPTVEGKEFTGWSDESGNPVNADVVVEAGTSFTAVYKVVEKPVEEKVKVTFVDGDKVIKETEFEKDHKLEGKDFPAAPVVEKKVFKGWKSGDGKIVENGFVVSESVTLTAYYEDAPAEEEFVVITFVGIDGNELKKTTLTKGAKIQVVDMPEAPKVDGMIFAGWKKTDDSYLEANQEITEDITVIADYTDEPENYVVVTFADADSNVIMTIEIEKGSELYSTDFPAAPVVEGKTFKGWKKPDGSLAENGMKVDDSITLTAYYEEAGEKEEVTVEFTDKDGKVLATVKLEKGARIQVSDMPEDPVIEGMIFEGWQMEDGKYFEANTVVDSDLKVKAVYVPVSVDKFTITFNDADNKLIEKKTVDKGAEFEGSMAPAAPELPGKTFKGWKKADGSFAENGMIVLEDVVLTAYYEDASPVVEKVNVIFNDVDGKNIKKLGIEKGARLQAADFPTAPEIAGKEFKGWKMVDGSFAEVNIAVDADMVLTAYYEDVVAEKVTITFADADGNVIDSRTFDKGYKLTGDDFAAAPTLQGKIFKGWKQSDGSFVENGFEVNANITLTAFYEDEPEKVEKVKVTFKDADGKEIKSIEIDKDSRLQSSDMPKQPEIEGKLAKGWKDESGEFVQANDIIKADTTLSAYYEDIPAAEKVKVTFNGQDGREIKTISLDKGSKLQASDMPEAPALEGKIFKGWKDANGNIAENGITISADTIFTAFYEDVQEEEKSVKLTFKDEAGKVILEKEIQKGSRLQNSDFPAPPAIAGKVFKGWKDASGNFAQANTVIDTDIVLTAYYELMPVTEMVKVTFNGQDNKTIKVVELEKGAKLTSEHFPTADEISGKTFKGWKMPDGSFAENGMVVLSDVILTAYYEDIPEKAEMVNIKFNDAQGKLISEKSIEKGSRLQLGDMPQAPAVSGKIFKGWRDESGKIIEVNTVVNADMILTAYYENEPEVVKNVKVTFLSEDGKILSVANLTKGGKLKGDDFPTAPEIAGKEFKGWKMPDGKIAEVGLVVNEDLALSAYYEAAKAEKVVVKFFDESGKNLISTATLDKGGRLQQSDIPAAPKIDGKLFVSWNTKDGKVIEANSEITEDTEVIATYKAVVVAKVKVIFKGEDGKVIAIKEINKGSAISASDFPTAPEVKDKAFKGWKTSDGKFVESGTVINTDTIYTAYYEVVPVNVEKFYIIFRDKDGKELKKVEFSKGMRLQAGDFPDVPKVEGKEFAGWRDSNGKLIQANDVIEGDMVLIATYSEIAIQKVKVTFKDKDGKEIKTFEISKGSKLANSDFPSNQTASGKVFKGWINESKELVSAGMVINKDTVLTPLFEDAPVVAEKVNVIFKNADGTEIKRIQLTKDSAIQKDDFPADPVKAGWKFAGWKAEDGSYVLAGKVISKDTTLTAAFEQASVATVKVTFVDYDGKVIKIVDVEKGGHLLVSDVPDPSARSGYKFVSWRDINGRVVNTSTIITEAVKLSPYYEKVEKGTTGGDSTGKNDSTAKDSTKNPIDIKINDGNSTGGGSPSPGGTSVSSGGSGSTPVNSGTSYPVVSGAQGGTTVSGSNSGTASVSGNSASASPAVSSGSTAAKSGSSTSVSGAAKTGDTTNVLPIILLMIASSMAVLGTALTISKKRTKK